MPIKLRIEPLRTRLDTLIKGDSVARAQLCKAEGTSVFYWRSLPENIQVGMKHRT